MLDRGVRFENVAMGERRPTALIRRYGNLYAQSRVDTLDALDSIPELEHAHDLKSKILFSAVVVSIMLKNTRLILPYKLVSKFDYSVVFGIL